MKELEIWGGPECTVNRVGEHFNDQFALSGHDRRAADLDLFAGLGLSAVRYPVLWESVTRGALDRPDWGWADARLTGLRDRGLRVIAGLVHHGSGPRHTNLLDPGFATGLAEHARQVAERYPWLDAWTPVNEPLTTARFAALYGHWYPHHRDEGSFWLALVNQIDAVRLSMRAVRKVNPAAQLIQTEDLGRTYATVEVRDQAAFDNVRRWMTWDLLTGRVVPGHDFWRRLCDFGLEERLRVIADDPCPPDIVGVNHYLTSDRFLDHRMQRYPVATRGGSGQRAYVDTEAVRVLEPPPPGLSGVLREAWQRYGIPVAVTEVHNGCTREEQMRWTENAWRTAHALRSEGVQVDAVTAWALLGSHDWNTLLTAPGRYEPGVYDVSGGAPRATAMVGLLRKLRQGGDAHPVLAGAGWWRRHIRLAYPPAHRPAPLAEHLPGAASSREIRRPPILIVGATGTLGQALAAACRHRDIAHVLTGRAELDLDDPSSIAAALATHRPWVVVNAAGWVKVDAAEAAAEACMRANAAGAATLAAACAARGIATVSFSSDLVFDGQAGRAYLESDRPAPCNVYGRSKVAAEQAIGALPGVHLVVRTAAFFSPFDPHNFAFDCARALREGRRFRACDDCIVTPTYVPDLCDAVLDLAIDGVCGIWHLSSGEAISWADLARRVAIACGLDAALIDAAPAAAFGWAAPRPAAVPLASERGLMLPPLHEALQRFARELAAGAALAAQRTAA